MDKNVRNALSILKESFINEYDQRLHRIWRDIIHLNSGVYILKKLQDFPFEFLDENSTFWEIAYTSIYESTILIIWRLLLDKKGVTSMERLKNDIMRNILDEKYYNNLKSDTRSLLLRAIKSKYSRQIKEVRHGRLAHSKDRHFSWSLLPSFRNNIEIRLKEFIEMQTAISQYFDMLCLTVGRGQWPFDYNPNVIWQTHLDSKTDIERICELLLKNNALVNMPEKQENFWPYYRRQNLSEEDLIMLNKLRESIGLPKFV